MTRWLEAAVRKVFRLTPSAIIETLLELARPIYRQTAAYGHFGRDDASTSPGSAATSIEALKSALA
jgi:S-adenosylmethionine synthetase